MNVVLEYEKYQKDYLILVVVVEMTQKILLTVAVKKDLDLEEAVVLGLMVEEKCLLLLLSVGSCLSLNLFNRYEHIACNDHIHAIEKNLLKILAFYTKRGSFLIRNHLRLYTSHISIPI